MDNVVNFSTLKRREIKCVIFETKDAKMVVENNTEKIDKLLLEIENPIIIYNPTQSQKETIHKIINNSFSKDGKLISINPEDIILDILPIISNIVLDLHRDNSEDMKTIKEIINDPQPIFERTIIVIKEVIKEISSQYLSVLNDIIEMPKEARNTLFNANKPQLTEKELKKIELTKQLKELDMEEVKQEDITKKDVIVTPSNL